MMDRGAFHMVMKNKDIQHAADKYVAHIDHIHNPDDGVCGFDSA